MKLDLDKTFPVAAPPSAGWQLLSDIPAVAACMPGASITETVDEQNYRGQVKAKVGPASMAFAGTIEVLQLDAESRTLHFVGKGSDGKGSSAQMDLTATIGTTDDGFELRGIAVVTVLGKAATLGGRLMPQVADQILTQFGENFANNAVAVGGSAEEADAAREAIASQPREINGLVFAWQVFITWIKSLFGSSSSKDGGSSGS